VSAQPDPSPSSDSEGLLGVLASLESASELAREEALGKLDNLQLAGLERPSDSEQCRDEGELVEEGGGSGVWCLEGVIFFLALKESLLLGLVSTKEGRSREPSGNFLGGESGATLMGLK